MASESRGSLSGPLPALVATGAVCIGVFLRLRGFSTLLPWGDEFHSLAQWREPLLEILSTYDDRGSGIALPLLQRAFHDLLGPTFVAARMPALLGGLATLVLVYPVGRRLVGSSAAAIATVAVALSPILVFYSHFGRAYSVATALSLVFVAALHGLLHRDGSRARRRVWFAAAAISGALLPWAHASAAVLPLAVGLAALVDASIRDRSTRRLVEIAACLALGFMGCLFLYLPAWNSAVDFLVHTAGSGARHRVSAVVVLSVLSGSASLAWVLLFGVPVGAVAHLVMRRSAGLLLAAAALASVAVLWVVSPRGGPYAYARYLLPSLPFAYLLLGALFVALAERLESRAPRSLRGGTIAAGALLILLAVLSGHSSPAPRGDGPFGGTYLSLWPLHRFDSAWEDGPAWYETLGANADISRILEIPMTRSRGFLLYRNYYLQHRKTTWLGEVGQSVVEDEGIVSLSVAKSACASGADVAIVHFDLERELAAWWEEVYPPDWSFGLPRTFIALSRTFESTPLWFRRRGLSELRLDFERTFGPPVYKDRFIEVYTLRGCDDLVPARAARNP